MRKKLAALMGISVAMIILMIYIVDPYKMVDILLETNLFLILLVVLLYFANGLVKTLRWYLLLSSSGTKISFSRLYLFLLIGLMFNNTTPGRVSGEPIRAYLLRTRDDVPIGQGMSTIFVERIMDLIVLTSMALIGIALIIPQLLSSDMNIQLLLISFIPVVVIIITLIYLTLHPELLKRAALGLSVILKKISKKDWESKIESGLLSFVDSFSEGIDNMGTEIRKKKRTGAALTFLTLLIWLNEAFRIYLILLALPGISAPSFGAVLIASSIATVFGALLPIGALHATLISSIFTALRTEFVSSTTAGLLTVMTSIWLSIPLGIISMFVVGLKVDKASGELVSTEVPVSDETAAEGADP